jgi:hypothetical protein
MRRRLQIGLVAAALALAGVACGEKDEPGVVTTPEITVPATTAPAPTVPPATTTTAAPPKQP